MIFTVRTSQKMKMVELFVESLLKERVTLNQTRVHQWKVRAHTHAHTTHSRAIHMSTVVLNRQKIISHRYKVWLLTVEPAVYTCILMLMLK